jgi:pyruvate dehydrogenase E1 component
LRNHFEVDARYVVIATLHSLAREGKIKPDVVHRAMKDFEIDPEKVDPMTA